MESKGVLMGGLIPFLSTFLYGHGGQEHYVIALPELSIFMFSLCRIVFGTLYPAYSSYKAVKSRDLKEYVSTCACIFSRWNRHRVKVSLIVSISPLTLQVKWMMYWIIFALFSTVEVFTDMFLCWWVQLFHHLTDFISTPKTHGFLLGCNFLFIFFFAGFLFTMSWR